MTTSSHTAERMVTKTFQAGLLVAMPVALYALGGPIALWNNGNTFVRILLAANLLPSAICTAGTLESCARTALLSLKNNSSSSPTEHKKAMDLEIRRTTGMVRAALFPITGWAVLVKLPVKDYYVYYIPKEVIKKTASTACEVARRANDVLIALKFWECIRFTFNHTVKPVCTHVVAPVCDVIGIVVSGALSLLSASLGRT